METFSTLRSGSGIRSASEQTKLSPSASPRDSALPCPTLSMLALMSDRITRPAPRSFARKATSPVPAARSSRVSRGEAAMAATKARFHSRWMPSDIRSFMTS